MTEAPSILLFSYGTLQQEAVQLANFGRRLEGEPDAVIGYRLATVAIDDPEVVAESGSAEHPILIATGSAEDIVEGVEFRISEAELVAADDYETAAYARVEAPLRSSCVAWVYVQPPSDEGEGF